MIPREADYPYGRELEFCGGRCLVVATRPVEDAPVECPFMVLVRRPGCDPHSLDWVPVSSLRAELHGEAA